MNIFLNGNNRAHDLLLVRINDVIEHIARVLSHVRRLESSIESAVQIHFSIMAHRTRGIMRPITVITTLFIPLKQGKSSVSRPWYAGITPHAGYLGPCHLSPWLKKPA